MKKKRRFAFVAGLLAVTLPPALVVAAPRATTTPVPIVADLRPQDVRDLYSARARRLVQTYLRLRMLELRRENLDRARAVIEGRLGVDALLASPAPAP